MSIFRTKVIVCFMVILLLSLVVACDNDEIVKEQPTPMQNIEEVDPSPEPVDSSDIEPVGPYLVYEPGHGSPEGTVIAFFSALRDSNISRMIDMFVEDINDDELASSFSMEVVRGSYVMPIIEHYIVMSIYSSGKEMDEFSGPQALHTDVAVEEFYLQISEVLDSPDLSTLNVLGFIALEEMSRLGQVLNLPGFYDTYLNAQAKERFEDYAKSVGADSFSVCFAVFEINGNPYLQIFELLEFSGDWYIAELGGRIGRELVSSLFLHHDLHGLLPLYHVSIYSGVDVRTVDNLRDEAFAVMSRIEGFDDEYVKSTFSSIIYEGPGSNSPEDAARVYLEGLRDSSSEQMLSAFAMESVVQGIDLRAIIDWAGFYSPESMILPNVNDFVTSMNVENGKKRMAESILQKYFLLYASRSRY